MADIYNIAAWANDTYYKKNAVVLYNAKYYYCLQAHTSTSSDFNVGANLWGGYYTIGSEIKPYFIWTPSYGSTVTSQPKNKSIQFGDGYTQELPDGINNLLLSIDFNFDDRDLDETTSILHFLASRASTAESFVFIPPPPRAQIKRFKCKEWSDRQNFYNNYSITARFNEVVV